MIRLALLACLGLGCAGPVPELSRQTLHAPAAGSTTYQAEAFLHNASGGRGQVQVRFRLRERTSGFVVEREQRVQLAPHQTTYLRAELDAPAGHYALEVAAEYPPL